MNNTKIKLKVGNKHWLAENLKDFQEYEERYRAKKLLRKRTYNKWWKKHKEDPVKKYKRMKRWVENNPEYYVQRNNLRRAIYSKTDITSPWLKWLFESTEYCIYCGVKMTENGREVTGKTLDHIKPISKKGKHVMSNVRVICLHCNVTKKALEEAEHWEKNIFSGVHVEAVIDKTIIISI